MRPRTVARVPGLVVLMAVLAAGLSAQTAAPGGTRYLVGYVGVKPASSASFRAAFSQYKEASRTETGFMADEVLEQIGKAGEFVVIETWRDQETADAHVAAASRKAFFAALEPIRVTGYDERPYKTFTVAAPRADPAGSVLVLTHVDVAPPGDATSMLKRLADESRAEPGCLRFDVLQHTVRANHFTVIEAWRNQQARDAHAAAVHTRQYRDTLQPIVGSPLDERLMKRP